MTNEEFTVFAGEDVVCHCCYGEFFAEGFAEGEHEGGFAGAYWSWKICYLGYCGDQGVELLEQNSPTNSYCEGPFVPVAAFDDGHFATQK